MNPNHPSRHFANQVLVMAREAEKLDIYQSLSHARKTNVLILGVLTGLMTACKEKMHEEELFELQDQVLAFVPYAFANAIGRKID